ncbi:hypothetical protein N44_01369 [Microcystis aeruginosa NIES-44]|uniref:Uncharacterized protein n=1 Tax=Microcystis aeruginosa NIES-44 TaxID=449439 RepID=A0A0A1VU50_MICAE|nr:hypothetical protein N44_01369 [Microcystis aeruginosa NIES-44]
MANGANFLENFPIKIRGELFRPPLKVCPPSIAEGLLRIFN